MNEYSQIRYWVDDLHRIGRNTFFLSEVSERFPQKPPSEIKNALNRLSASGKTTSVWQGFYAVVLPEYGLNGVIPPIEYIDHLKKQNPPPGGFLFVKSIQRELFIYRTRELSMSELLKVTIIFSK